MTELLLVQPPFWSPFQPPLSLAALTAWLRSAGHTVHGLDLNLAFFQWLLSDECARLMLDQAHPGGTAADRAVLACASELRDEVTALHATDHTAPLTVADVRRHFLVSSWLSTHLAAVSRLDGGLALSLWTGLWWRTGLSPEGVERLVAQPPRVVASFLDHAIPMLLDHVPPAAVGISCLGQDQLPFTLMLGLRLKAATDVHVVVGGSYVPRLLDSGALSPTWFGRAFDLVVRGQGEVPAEALLANLGCGRHPAEGVPGVIRLSDDGLISTPPSKPLPPSALPVPDFGDLPIGDYLAPEPRLPLLASSGCYWGRCEFCTFDQASDGRHRPYPVELILRNLRELSARHGVRHFEFSDEAVPPATLRAMARTFPDHEDSGWAFSSMVRFEESLGREDFEGLHRIGYRILKLGLESASERVLGLMEKPTRRETIVRNLTDATEAGLWTHALLFFGFPGERDEDAAETVDFVRDHSRVIGSVGAGVFSLVHAARMTAHLNDFGVRARPRGDVSLIYDYQVAHGNGPQRAQHWRGLLCDCISHLPKLDAASRMLPEMGLALLSETPSDRLVTLALEACKGPRGERAPTFLSSEVLDPLAAVRYQFLLPTHLQTLLLAATNDGPVVAIGASWRGTPAGITIVHVPDHETEPMMHTAIRPGHQSLGLERLLANRLVAELARRRIITPALAQMWRKPLHLQGRASTTMVRTLANHKTGGRYDFTPELSQQGTDDLAAYVLDLGAA